MTNKVTKIENCLFTGLAVESFIDYVPPDTISYYFPLDESIQINIHNGCVKSILLLPFEKRYLVGSMILNGLINLEKFHEFHSTDYRINPNNYRLSMEEILKNIPSQSPQEKLDKLLLDLEKEQKNEGSEFEINLYNYTKKILIKNYIQTLEGDFYIKSLNNLGYIDIKYDEKNHDYTRYDVNFTMKGIQYLYEMSKSGQNSNVCFIAMSFKSETQEIREAIKNTLILQKYEPLIIDEIQIDNEKTINDAIIAGIKKSRFVIADFTFQSDGVYFESGYALGTGRKVIYTCRSDSFKETHFDINHFPHIIYDNVDELKKKLKDKIEAWID